jgi:hypothetical protein
MICKEEIYQLTEAKEEIRALGLASVAALCQMSLDHRNVSPNLIHVLFSIMATLLPPYTPPDTLKQLLDQLFHISSGCEIPYLKVVFARCMAISGFHLLIHAQDPVAFINNMIKSLDSTMETLLLSELCAALDRALDVPILSQTVILFIRCILPCILPTLIESFVKNPNQYSFDALEIALRRLQPIPLSELPGDNSLDETLISRTSSLLSNGIHLIPNIFRSTQNISQKILILKFLTSASSYKIDLEVLSSCTKQIFSEPLDFAVISNLILFLKNISKIRNSNAGDWFYSFVEEVAIACATSEVITVLQDLLTFVSICPWTDQRISSLMAKIFAIQINACCFATDPENEDLFEDLIELEVFLTLNDPLPCF